MNLNNIQYGTCFNYFIYSVIPPEITHKVSVNETRVGRVDGEIFIA